MKKTISNTALELDRFLSNVNKLDKNIHVRTVHPFFGTVTLKKTASENSGKRLFSVSSKVIHSGSYTTAGLKRAFSTIA